MNENAEGLSDVVIANARPEILAWLDAYLERHEGFAGCVHLAQDGALVLVAARGLPVQVQNAVATVTYGKGVAGITAERREPVVLRDAQTDDSGVLRPRGKDVGTRGSVSVPVLGPDGAVLAIVGFGLKDEHLFTDEEVAAYQADAVTVLEAGAR